MLIIGLVGHALLFGPLLGYLSFDRPSRAFSGRIPPTRALMPSFSTVYPTLPIADLVARSLATTAADLAPVVRRGHAESLDEFLDHMSVAEGIGAKLNRASRTRFFAVAAKYAA